MKLVATTLAVSLFAACGGTPAANVERVHVPDEHVTAIADGSNDFGLRLYAELATEPGNVVVSPWSISTALAMVHAGARGETATEMQSALAFPFADEQLDQAYAAAIAALNAEENELNVANALFVQDGYALQDAFVNTVKGLYGADARAVEFRSATEESRVEINEWVEDKTNDRIQNLFPEGTLTDLTRLVLANAVYFKGTWTEPFDTARTREADFHLADGSKTKVQLMYRKEQTAYFRGEGFQAADVAYEGERLSMLLLLPDGRDGLPALEAQLSTELLAQIVDGLHETELPLFLPRFEVSGEFGLRPQLEALGMKHAFSNTADLSGVNGKTDLYIQAVRHKAWMKVDEEGTEAAAATGVALGVKSAMPRIEFRADHPFVFAIRDRVSGAILFMGRLAVPE